MTITPYERSFRALGFQFVVRSSLPGSGPVLDGLLAGFRTANDAPSGSLIELRPGDGAAVDVMVGDALLVSAVDAGSAIDHLVAEVTARALRSDHPYVAVHAGVVSTSGFGLMIPGAPGSGKSTLTCALVRDGFGFLSDEVALIEPRSGLVHPFARPAALSPASMAILGLPIDPAVGSAFQHFERHLSAEDLRPGAASGAVPVGYIVAPNVAPGLVSELEPFSRSDALELLVEQCFDLERLKGFAVSALGELVRGADCHRLRVGEISSAVAVVRGLSRVLPDRGP